MIFKDNFSKHADSYVKYRPHYPLALYEFLASLTPGHTLAWDCGTGNGQAAIDLAKFYDQVIATDPSAEQLKYAAQHGRITYRNEKAEQSSLASHSADLVVIANALHWFDLEPFFKEVKRVLNPQGVIAAMACTAPLVSPDIDRIVSHYHDEVLHNYWLPENRLVEKEYNTIPFPFEPVATPEFVYEKPMSRQDMTGYLNTWSATQRFIAQNGHNPTPQVDEQLQAVWKDDAEKTARWKIILKVGRN